MWVLSKIITPDKVLFSSKKYWCFFWFLHKNMWVLIRSALVRCFYEFPQHMISPSWRNKKNILWILPLICSYGGCSSEYPQRIGILFVGEIKYQYLLVEKASFSELWFILLGDDWQYYFWCITVEYKLKTCFRNCIPYSVEWPYFGFRIFKFSGKTCSKMLT